MELNWLQSLFYGLVCGLAEFFPVSAEAHRRLYLTLFGGTTEEPGLVFAVRVGCLAALIFSVFPLITRLYRDSQLSGLRRSKHRADPGSLATLGILKIAVFPVLLALVAMGIADAAVEKPWVLSIILALSGVVLYIPRHLPSGNKGAAGFTFLDSLLMGLSGALGVIPGVSRVGMMLSVTQMRGADRRFSFDLCLILCIPVLLVLSAISGISTIAAGGVEFLDFLRHTCSAATAFLGAYLSIFIMRFLAFKSDHTGFAYYSWGLALATFIVYLAI